MSHAASPSSPALEAIGFDLDGTLHDRETSLRLFIEAQHERLALAPHVPLATWRERFITLDAGGMVWKDRVYQILTTEWLLPRTWQELLADYEDNFHLSACLFADALETLSTLRSRGLTLGLITNGRARLQGSVIEALGIADFFSAILISESEGVAKPDAEIFRRFLARVSCPAEAAAFVGDSLRADAEGARNAGLLGVWLNRDATAAHPDESLAIVGSLSSLLSLHGLSSSP
ncbi:HAD family hydrolase [Uliginosibacterium sp. H3]|uniref:HAD family hydrolase n=1 Tax=Uliginosibacterium silvisoli TaxID=3114758 RepID=A0ABU6K7A5_9RHOO|nr:HAD family hydrolase [Uliginosibacterium sp. H3]